MTATAISVESISKRYQLGVINHGVLFRDIQSWWARARSLPDPNLKIGARTQAGNFNALQDVSFSVRAGETVGIIGRNGAGKSTLLKILSRVTAPSSGRIRVRGRIASLLEVGTGFHPELTGRENVFLNGAILGMTKPEIRRKFDEIVDFAEVGAFIDTPVKRYSSGMYVRLAFAVAAHLEPEILVVDEVLAVGDHEFQKKCIGKMQDVGAHGRTVLFVSHNMTAVNNLCARSILLRSGQVVADGPSSDVTRLYLKALDQGEQARWICPPDSSAGKQAYIAEMAVLDPQGTVREGYELTEDLRLRIRYHLSEAMGGITLGLQVSSDETGETIISLSDSELERSRLGVRRAGEHITEVRLPNRLLNTGVYSLRIGISRGRHEILDVAEGLAFRIIDSVGIVQYLGFERKGSQLAMQLPWTEEAA
ncbi:MAG: polysaccharide transporter Wzt-like ATP-binding protein [Betaproteobacteria bacterium]|nr:polysaccharide transporter Wzt-like ATP-binding protein [Betaproteobacteria bacterium]